MTKLTADSSTYAAAASTKYTSQQIEFVIDFVSRLGPHYEAMANSFSKKFGGSRTRSQMRHLYRQHVVKDAKPESSAPEQRLERSLWVPDTHRPYHDKRAWALMLNVAKSFKPDAVLVCGDFGDFYGVSSHSKDPTRVNQLEYEVSDINDGLDDLLGLGAKLNVFIAGNHEDRLERYIKDKAPALFDTVSIEGLFDLKAKGWKYVPYKDYYKYHRVNVTHDTGTAGQDAHLKALNDFQGNVVIGHTHRLAYAVRGNAQGKPHVAAMFGWLGDVSRVDYMHKVKANRDWALGFGIGYTNTATGAVYLQPVPIVNYTCVVGGKLYSVTK